jgi:hypothetical protein
MSRTFWPTRDEYDRAIIDQRHDLQDSSLKNGKLYQKMGNPQRYGGASLYVTIYRIDNWLVRCFCSTDEKGKPIRTPPEDIAQRYQLIAAFTQSHVARVSALIPVTYLAQGIRVNGNWYPCVKMPFLTDAMTLGNYLREHHTDSMAMAHLGTAWIEMISQLKAAQVAHGDLDLTNVMVIQPYSRSSPQLKLIDYDNMWLPQLHGQKQNEFGHEAFQHPAFLPPNPRPYTMDMDRFSALVIYTCIKALELQPGLYAGSDESERLLFTQQDYNHPTIDRSNLMVVLKRCGQPIKPYIEELCSCLLHRDMPCWLDEIPVRGRKIPLFGTASAPSRGLARMAQAVEGTQVSTGQQLTPTPTPVANRVNQPGARPSSPSYPNPPAQITVSRTPSVPVKKKNNTALLIGVIIGLIVLLAFVIALIVQAA